MIVEDPDSAASAIAAAIGEPARARMLYCLMDGLARTSTELAMVADVSPSTASVHLKRLQARRLVTAPARRTGSERRGPATTMSRGPWGSRSSRGSGAWDGCRHPASRDTP